MKLYELVERTSWQDVKEALIKNNFLNNDEDEKSPALMAFKKAMGCLLSTEPVDSQTILSFKVVISDGQAELNLMGTGGRPDTDSIYGLAMTHWREWPGLQIDDDIYNNFPAADIVAFCLYEMTYFGSDVEHVDATIEKVKREERKKQRTAFLVDLKHRGRYDIMWRRLERNGGNGQNENSDE